MREKASRTIKVTRTTHQTLKLIAAITGETISSLVGRLAAKEKDEVAASGKVREAVEA